MLRVQISKRGAHYCHDAAQPQNMKLLGHHTLYFVSVCFFFVEAENFDLPENVSDQCMATCMANSVDPSDSEGVINLEPQWEKCTNKCASSEQQDDSFVGDLGNESIEHDSFFADVSLEIDSCVAKCVQSSSNDNPDSWDGCLQRCTDEVSKGVTSKTEQERVYVKEAKVNDVLEPPSADGDDVESPTDPAVEGETAASNLAVTPLLRKVLNRKLGYDIRSVLQMSFEDASNTVKHGIRNPAALNGFWRDFQEPRIETSDCIIPCMEGKATLNHPWGRIRSLCDEECGMVLSVASLQEVNLTFGHLGYPGLMPPVPEVNCVGNRAVVFVLCVH